jgi:ferrous iron transport protein A
MQLGLIEGASVEILRCAPSGDPIEISVMGYALSLRRAEANLILVSPEPT